MAFGHSAPASGRRCTTLVSLLADLGEFLTQEGITDSAYYRGFPGYKQEDLASAASHGEDSSQVAGGDLEDGQVVTPDLTRAPELTPYRDLDASRLKMERLVEPCRLPR